MSVECAAQKQHPQDFNNDIPHDSPLSDLLDTSFPAPHGDFSNDYVQDYPPSHLEPFAFTHGSDDACLAPPLDFSFDDFLCYDQDNSATAVAFDTGVGAA